LRLFASLTEDYEERFPTDSKELLKNDWWKALQFFFGRAFYQGRRDVISEEVERRVINVLSRYFSDEVIRDSEFDRMKEEGWKKVRQELEETIGKGKMGKKRDIVETIDTMMFVYSLPERNIVNYSVREIRLGKIHMHFRELQHAIEGVGPKISSLYLRDIVSLFDLGKCLRTEQDYRAVMPVDTWIRKITKSLGFVRQERPKDNEIIKAIVEKCKESNISPIRINQGIWYAGTHSFEACFDRVLKALEEMKKGIAQEASNQLLECIGILEVLISLEEDRDEIIRLKDHISRLSSLVQS